MSYNNVDDDFDYGLLQKDDPQTRMGFVRKVYGILTVQLGFTALCTATTMSSPTIQKALMDPGLLTFVVITYFISIIALICCGLDKKVPTNYILLAIFTGCVSYMVSVISCRYDPITVVEAAFLTASMTCAITVYAATTKSDFTVCGPIMFIIGFVFAVASIFSFLWGPTGRLVYACIGVILFSFYLLIDTQMIIGGKNRKYKIDADSYILASVALYLDIINIFIYILQILGDR